MSKGKVMEVLRRVEWVGDNWHLRCALCGAWKSQGHYGGCKLAALLEEGAHKHYVEGKSGMIYSVDGLRAFSLWCEKRQEWVVRVVCADCRHSIDRQGEDAKKEEAMAEHYWVSEEQLGKIRDMLLQETVYLPDRIGVCEPVYLIRLTQQLVHGQPWESQARHGGRALEP